MNTATRPNLRNIVGAGILVLFLIALIDLMTNTFDLEKHAWDFKYYIAFAKEGFDMENLISPVAYRYMTPFLAAAIHHLFSFSIPESFKILSYIGLWLQLMGVYLFIFYYTHSLRGAVIAVLVTAFSAINVKFLLFDPFRPDLFAYFFIVLSTYFAFQKRVFTLLIVSAIGVQFREFAIVPMIAYFATLLLKGEWDTLKKYILPFIATLIIAVLLPRLLIHVTESYQYVKNLHDLLLIPQNLQRDFNWLYTILIYFLPTLILMTKERMKQVLNKISPQELIYIIIYTLLVALLSMYGGTDLSRFSTFMFLPQIIFVGLLAPLASRIELIYLVISVFLFNKIHTNIPVGDFNWYGGYDNIISDGTYLHLIWMAAIIVGAIILRIVLSFKKI